MNKKYVDKKRWVSNTSRKRFACPTEDEVDQQTDTWKDASQQRGLLKRDTPDNMLAQESSDLD